MSGARSGGQQRYFSLQSKALESPLTYSTSENQGLLFLFLFLLPYFTRSYYLACWTQCRWCRCHSAGCRFRRLVLSPLRAGTTRHDAARRRVSSRSPMLVRRDPSLQFILYRLHAIKYPWVHESFTKTFDHQTYLPPSSFLYSS